MHVCTVRICPHIKNKTKHDRFENDVIFNSEIALNQHTKNCIVGIFRENVQAQWSDRTLRNETALASALKEGYKIHDLLKLNVGAHAS